MEGYLQKRRKFKPVKKNTHKLSTEPYKGVRDFYPEAMRLERFIFDTMRRSAESFGYIEYGASILEPAELYEAKSSEEIALEQTYTFTDRGDRRVTLRPEMTPTLARMVAAKRRDYALPLRWYSIPNLFRYERPQKGRLREHFQLNCDLFGVAGIEAEVEIISLAYRLMKNFGAKDEDFEIRINNRAELEAVFARYNLNETQAKKLRILIDKKDKIEGFEEAAAEIVGGPFDLPAVTDLTVDTLLGKLANLGVTNAVAYPSLVRGFDYYTGVVFEVFDKDSTNNRSLFGGGRYDNLLEIFGSEKVPAVGFGMGDVTIADFLETRNLLPAYRAPTLLSVCTLSKDYIENAWHLGESLRARGIAVAVNITEKSMSDQIKKADKDKVPFILCVGETEVREKRYKLKHLETGKETEVSEEDIVPFLQTKSV